MRPTLCQLSFVTGLHALLKLIDVSHFSSLAYGRVNQLRSVPARRGALPWTLKSYSGCFSCQPVAQEYNSDRHNVETRLS
ncbi:hypothetical protein F4802DRAFT_582769 [Xylaria palmicola]|nr:hypothetical protein F4802DRAFT_582769 [Xylaria palmicola]